MQNRLDNMNLKQKEYASKLLRDAGVRPDLNGLTPLQKAKVFMQAVVDVSEKPESWDEDAYIDIKFTAQAHLDFLNSLPEE